MKKNLLKNQLLQILQQLYEMENDMLMVRVICWQMDNIRIMLCERNLI